MPKAATAKKQRPRAAGHRARRSSAPPCAQPVTRHPESIAPHRPQAPQPNQVRYISPFRYPGGKNWFVKTARRWLKTRPYRPTVLVEPFAGGAGISLTAANENLVDKAAFAERDPDVAATWEVMLNGEAKWLANRILSFRVGRKRIEKLLARTPPSTRQRAFHCLVRNRTARGGVITKGAGLIREGEGGRGLKSRWYPKSLAKRIDTISSLKSKLQFTNGDGFRLIEMFLDEPTAVFFVDPPYTQASRRLYTHWEIDHEALFKLLSCAKGDVLMTYDDTEEIRGLATKYGFQFKRISMRTTHHEKKRELMISKTFNWKNRHAKRK